MKALWLMFLIMTLPLLTPSVEAQIWPFRKKSSIRKATSNLEKRKQETSPETTFNPLQPMGAGSNYQRNDFIWSAASANTSYKHAGNLALSSPSRFGLSGDLELSSWMGLNYWVPNLFVKKNYLHKKWILSSLHGIYSATPGLSYVKNGQTNFLADSVSNAPLILSIKNQIILSRPFFDALDCKSGQPYLVLSGGIAVDVGFPFSDEQILIPDEHFISPRSQAYAGKGWLLTTNVQADWTMTSSIFGHAAIRILQNDFPRIAAIEQQTSAELFFNQHFSGSIGYLLSFGNLGSNMFQVLPFLDLSYYFGKKKERERTLFKRKMF